VTEEAALQLLQDAYRHSPIRIRHFEDAPSYLRWQMVANGDGEHYTLLAHGSTPKRLLESLDVAARANGRGNGH